MFDAAAIRTLRSLCSPDAEAMSEKARIDMLVEIGHQAADEIERLQSALGHIVDGVPGPRLYALDVLNRRI